MHSFVFIFHTRIEWSFEQEANIAPSGWTRTIRTHSRWPTYDFTQYLYNLENNHSWAFIQHSHMKQMLHLKENTYPVATSHILILLSRDADSTKSPAGTNATDETLWSCPSIVLKHSNVCVKSHNFMDISALQEAAK